MLGKTHQPRKGRKAGLLSMEGDERGHALLKFKKLGISLKKKGARHRDS